MKWVIRILAGLLLLSLLAVATALAVLFLTDLPRQVLVQRIEGDTGRSAELAELDLGFSGLEAQGLVIDDPASGARIRLESASLRYSPWGLLGNRLNVEQLVVEGLEADLRQVEVLDRPEAGNPAALVAILVEALGQGAGGPPSSNETPGESAPLALDRFAVKTVALDARIFLPRERRIALSLGAEGIRVGALAQASFNLEAEDPTGENPYQQTRLSGILDFRYTADARLTQARLKSEVEAEPFPDSGAGPVALRLDADFSQSSAEAPARLGVNLSRQEGESSLVALEAQMEAALLRVSYRLDLGDRDLAPLLQGAPGLTFSAQGEGEIVAEDWRTLESLRVEALGNLSGDDLAVPEEYGLEPLRRIRIAFEANKNAGAPLSIRVPVEVTGKSRTSDLTAQLQIEPLDAGTFRADGSIQSEWIVLPDVVSAFQLLASPAALAAPPEVDPSGDPASPDEFALWSGVSGEFTLDLDRVETEPGYTVSGVDANLLIAPEAITLRDAQAMLGNSPLTARGTLVFRPDRPDPYRLDAVASLEQWRAESFFATASGIGGQPPLEGAFNLDARIEAEGPNLSLLIERLRGRFELQGGPGVLRPLTAAGNQSETARQAGRLAGLLGSSVQSDALSALSSLTRELEAIEFQDLDAVVTRGEDLDIVIERFEALGKRILITGSGRIDYIEGEPLTVARLDVPLSLGVRGTLAQSLETLGMLQPEPGREGYYSLAVPLRLTGTVGEPTAPAFQEYLRQQQRKWVDNLTGRLLPGLLRGDQPSRSAPAGEGAPSSPRPDPGKRSGSDPSNTNGRAEPARALDRLLGGLLEGSAPPNDSEGSNEGSGESSSGAERVGDSGDERKRILDDAAGQLLDSIFGPPRGPTTEPESDDSGDSEESGK